MAQRASNLCVSRSPPYEKIKIKCRSQNKQSVKGIQYNCFVSVWGSKHESAKPLEYNMVGVGVADSNSKE
ncbi:hypothetical protein GCM10008014_59220 [Paenibacillus silvae]|uniref:Uncharacterized protein n=1 Tax=Paenibacillus silvae TaxID=1325358 RepID=A0ABQ1ZRM0_9BACL|nr:hypothetical protein GCM10008014_59220 [Paenibacillus silvae]